MRYLFRPIPGPQTVLFVPASQPRDVFRILEPDRPAFLRPSASPEQEIDGSRTVSRALLLSGPPEAGALPWRIVCVAPQDDGKTADLAAGAFLGRLALRLSTRLEGTVYVLRVDPTGDWWVQYYRSGELRDADGVAQRPIEFWDPFSERYLGLFYKPAPLSLNLLAWARETGVPLRRAPLRKSVKKTGRIVDYDAVAGLERKGLLVETTPVWYRFPIEMTEATNEAAV